MGPPQFVVLFAAGALAVRLLGGFVCRVAGWLFMTGGAAALASEPGFGAVRVLAAGWVLWLVGHLHYALRHGAYKSPLGGRVLPREMRGRGLDLSGARDQRSATSVAGHCPATGQRRPISRTGKVS
jgi:hypothetical protein